MAAALAVLGLGGALLTGYVLPSRDLLRQWAREASRPAPRGAVEIPVQWQGRAGRLHVEAPGAHALELDGEPPRYDPGPGRTDLLAPLWRALDLFAVADPEELAALLEGAGLDLGRVGLARTARSGDAVAHTLGARGEGEPDLPQVWFSRVPLWPVRLALPGSAPLSVGPPGPGSWPASFLLPDGSTLEVTGAPAPVPPREPRANPGAGGPDADHPVEGWRGAFGEPRP